MKPIVFINGRQVSDGRKSAGGGPSYTRVHARAALRAGFEPHIFCPAPRDALIATDFGFVHEVGSPFRPFGAQFSAAHSGMLAASIEQFFAGRRGPHLIHSFIWWAVGIMVSRKLGRRGIEVIPISGLYTAAGHESRAKVLSLSRSLGMGQRWRFRAERLWTRLVIEREERKVYCNSRLLTVNYESVRRLFLDQYGDGPEIRKLPYTSESAFLNEAKGTSKAVMPPEIAKLSPLDAPLIVAISRHDPRKGIEILLRALADLRARGIPFRACLVGEGPLLAVHRRLAGQLGLRECTVMTGWVTDPFPYLQYADLFVLPSIQEGSGSLSLIEALQAGVAVVASRIDGIPEDVTDGESAVLVEPGSIHALSRGIESLLLNAALRHRLARLGREVFAQKFSPQVFTEALRKTYADLGVTPQ